MKITVFGLHMITKEFMTCFLQRGCQVQFCYNEGSSPIVRQAGVLALGTELVAYRDINEPQLAAAIAAFAPDHLISAIFNEKIPDHLIALPTSEALNYHPAPLPEYRTANAWFWPLRNGERRSAVCMHRLTSTWDGGDIVFRKEFDVDECDNQETYSIRIISVTRAAHDEIFALLSGDRITAFPGNGAAYYPRVTYADTVIEWTDPAHRIRDLVRACNPNHLAVTSFRGCLIYIAECEVTGKKAAQPGEVAVIDNRLFVAASDYLVEITVLRVAHTQVTGGALYSGSVFARRFRVRSGEQCIPVTCLPAYRDVLARAV